MSDGARSKGYLDPSDRGDAKLIDELVARYTHLGAEMRSPSNCSGRLPTTCC